MGLDVKNLKCSTIKNLAARALMQPSYLCSQAPLWDFIVQYIWTQWRFRLTLSGLQRVHGNTNETCLSAGQ